MGIIIKLISVIISLAVIVSATAFDEKCQNLIQDDSCDFYSQCLEEKYQCGEKGYPIGYGYKYCNKFLENFNDFPQKGQEWISKTLVCLKKTLNFKFLDCQDVYDSAFESHPLCYVESGFCDLFLDTEHLKQTMKALFKVYEIKDFVSAMSLKQVFQTSKLCGYKYLLKIGEIIKDIFSSAEFLQP